MKLTDKSLMPFGKHKQKTMEDVPASYFHYLWVNGKKNEVGENDVADYIQENIAGLMKEYPDGIWE